VGKEKFSPFPNEKALATSADSISTLARLFAK
jgi:hypothetical protein